jgi:hypothetical protein
MSAIEDVMNSGNLLEDTGSLYSIPLLTKSDVLFKRRAADPGTRGRKCAPLCPKRLPYSARPLLDL